MTFKSSLVGIKGTLRAANIYVSTGEDRRGRKSQVSELIFYLNERQQQFHLAENIDQEWRNETYNRIMDGLQRADTITVWVRRKEAQEYQPTIFEIDSDGIVLLPYETVREEKGWMTAFLLFMGLGSVIAFLWFRFPKKFNWFFGLND